MTNLGILIGPLLLAVGYPYVGKLAGVLGGICGFFCIYLIPLATFFRHAWVTKYHKNNASEEEEDGEADDDNFER